MRISIEIDAPVSTVWAEVARIERHPMWMADAESVEFLSDQRRGVGTRFRCPTRVGPLRTDDLLEITAWEEERTIGVVHRGAVTGEGTFVLESLDHQRRTRLTWTEQLTMPRWLGGPIGAQLATRLVLQRIWRGNLRRLRSLIEDGDGR